MAQDAGTTNSPRALFQQEFVPKSAPVASLWIRESDAALFYYSGDLSLGINGWVQIFEGQIGALGFTGDLIRQTPVLLGNGLWATRRLEVHQDGLLKVASTLPDELIVGTEPCDNPTTSTTTGTTTTSTTTPTTTTTSTPTTTTTTPTTTTTTPTTTTTTTTEAPAGPCQSDWASFVLNVVQFASINSCVNANQDHVYGSWNGDMHPNFGVFHGGSCVWGLFPELSQTGPSGVRRDISGELYLHNGVWHLDLYSNFSIPGFGCYLVNIRANKTTGTTPAGVYDVVEANCGNGCTAPDDPPPTQPGTLTVTMS